MEKEQPDSLATVAVGNEKMQSTHSHYAPSEVYSTAEPPPAYMRPNTKSTAVQIARIAAVTLVAMTVILGGFILAASWVQARASCTPESIAAMQLQLQQQRVSQKQGEFLKHLKPEALVQDVVDQKDNLQSLSESMDSKKELQPDTKDIKIEKDENNNKVDNDNGDADEEDDYDDNEFPPVHIKLPLQLDLDDIAGTLMQQARSRVSCVVERRRADEVMDGSDNSMDNSTDPQRFQRLSGERVAILCESGNPQQEQQEQEMMTPIIVPLGTVQIPLHPQEPANYNQYQIHTQYQVPDMQQLPLSDPRGLNHIPPGLLPPELRGLPQLTVEMRPPRMGPQSPMMGPFPQMMGPQYEMRRIPIELRHYQMDPAREMRPPMPQEPRQEQQIPMMLQRQEQQIPMMLQRQEQQIPMLLPRQEQHMPMMPPRQEQHMPMMPPRQEQHMPMMPPRQEQRIPMMPPRQEQPMPMMPPRQEQNMPMMPPRQEQPVELFRKEQQTPPMMPPQQEQSVRVFHQEQQAHPLTEQRPPMVQQAAPEAPAHPLEGIPIEIRRIIQQVPLEIKNIIQHITGEALPSPAVVPEGARREVVQEFKPFAAGTGSLPMGLSLQEVRNLLDHGSINGHFLQEIDSEEQQQQKEQQQEPKPFPGPDDQGKEVERNFPIPPEVRHLIHQVVEGRAFPVPRFPMPLRPVDSLDVPVEANAEVTDADSSEEQNEEQQQREDQQYGPLALQPLQQQDHDAENRAYHVQPRSIRSVPEPFSAHPRQKRVRRCACDCAC